MGGMSKYLSLYKRCPKNQLNNLKAIHDLHASYIRRLDKLPASKPEINWEHYKSSVGPERIKIVEEFEKKYEALEIPYPKKSSLSDEIDVIAAEVQSTIEAFNEESDKRIAAIEAEKERITQMSPYRDMTIEEYWTLRPEVALDFINKPTFWPHTPEEQLPHPNAEETATQAKNKTDSSKKSTSTRD